MIKMSLTRVVYKLLITYKKLLDAVMAKQVQSLNQKGLYIHIYMESALSYCMILKTNLKLVLLLICYSFIHYYVGSTDHLWSQWL